MRTRRLVTAAVAVTLGATALTAAPASAHGSHGTTAPTGTRSLAAVLTACVTWLVLSTRRPRSADPAGALRDGVADPRGAAPVEPPPR